MPASLAGFSAFTFEYEGKSRTVFRKGTGPGVVIMHEVPGITPEVQRFAERVADAGFTVFMPWLFGVPGKPFSQAYAARSILGVCISREFSIFAARRSSPICDWLRALCRHVHKELGGKGVGAIGMCVTGNFALTLMADEAVMAPVLSQPSLPVAITKDARAALHVTDEDLAAAKQRAAEGVPLLALRFTHDPLCRKERFDRLRQEFGSAFECREIDSSPGNPHRNPRDAHSVVTRHLIDEAGHPTREALERVLAFFKENLR